MSLAKLALQKEADKLLNTTLRPMAGTLKIMEDKLMEMIRLCIAEIQLADEKKRLIEALEREGQSGALPQIVEEHWLC
jgi:hypothetical protein